MNNRVRMITEEREGTVLLRLTLPMTAGILGMIIFNLVDTYFVGRLGTLELAALSFTFPVVLFISSIAHGLGVGMSAVVSRAAGRQDREGMIRLISHGMVLSFLVVLTFVIIGQLTIEPVFRLLGADEETLPVIREYMTIWYWGVAFVVVPMTGNAAIRGMGDTKTPGLIMILAAVVNTVLDPLFIFGIGPFPALGVAGAALATLIGRAVTFCVALYILIFREKVLSLAGDRRQGFWSSWKALLYIGIPNSLAKVIVPLGAGVLTGIIAGYGREAVAGYGVSTRIEMFALMFINALVSVLPTFIGQNWGAGHRGRVLKGIRISETSALIFGALLYILLFFLAGPLGKLFNSDPKVVDFIKLYFRIVPLAYGFQGMMLISATGLNVLGKPMAASFLTLVQMFLLAVPLAFLGSRFLGFAGIFCAVALSYLIMGPVSRIINTKNIRIHQEEGNG